LPNSNRAAKIRGKKKTATAVPPRGARKDTRVRPATRAGRNRSASAARQARRRRNRWAAISVAAVVAVVAAVVAVGLSTGGSGSAFTRRAPAPAGLVSHITSVALADLTGALAKVESSSNPLQPAIALNAAPLTSGAKPEVLYIGAEFCPICATERWAMVVALSKFGTFSGLSQIRSANRDGDIATLDFYGSRYTSSYLAFAPVEVETNQPSGSSYKPLQAPTAAEESLWVSTMAKFGQNPGFPFIDMDGRYLLYTSQIPDTTLSGLDWTQISSDIGDNNSTVGAGVDASAAALVKYFCSVTGDKPAATCAAVAAADAPVATTSPRGATSTAG
jgi:hypothetical protein